MSESFSFCEEKSNAGSAWHTTAFSKECFSGTLSQVNAACNAPAVSCDTLRQPAAGRSAPANQLKLPAGLENQLSVGQKVSAQYGEALSAEITQHWQSHLERNVTDMQGAVVMSYALCRVPKIAALAAVVATAAGLETAVQQTVNACTVAADADTNVNREETACAISRDLASQSVDFLPSLIGMGCGFGSGRLASRFASDYAVRHTRNNLLNCHTLEDLALLPHDVRSHLSRFRSEVVSTWHGESSDQLPAALINEDGTHNLMGITQWLADKHVWQGAEVTRYVRKSDLRASIVNTGTPSSVWGVDFRGNDAVFDFHIHPPSPTSMPSRADQRSARGFGIIQSGDQTTLYLPKKDLYKEVPYLQSGSLADVHIIFDRKRRLAMEAHPDLDSGVRALDYDELEKRLANFDGKWSTLRTTPTAPKIDKEVADFVWDNNI